MDEVTIYALVTLDHALEGELLFKAGHCRATKPGAKLGVSNAGQSAYHAFNIARVDKYAAYVVLEHMGVVTDPGCDDTLPQYV